MTNGSLIEASGLGAMRGERVLFTRQALSLARGGICLLRGANGSGKTTFLRLIAGLIPLETGKLNLNGGLHWLGHADGLKPHETPRRHLKHWARAWGSDADISEILETIGLASAADVAANGLSAGQRRRTVFGRLLLETRAVWLLDEPFSALDDSGKRMAAGLISEHCKTGGGVVAAVHGDVPLTGHTELTF
ncbi:MAG: heme ABC exporter ATP-binding protein CcmA [Pseudomonadota bacterium]